MLYKIGIHKEPSEVELVKKVNRKFVLVGGAVRVNSTYRVLPHSDK